MAEKTPENSAPESPPETPKTKSPAPKKKTAAKKKTAKSTKSTAAAKKKTKATGTKGGAKKKKSTAAKTGDKVKKTPATAKKKTAAPKKKPAPKKAPEPAEKAPAEMDAPATKPVETPPQPAEKAPVAAAAETVKTSIPEKTEKPEIKPPPPQPQQPSYTPPPATAEPDPVNKAIKYFLIGFCVLMLLIIGHSIRNTNKYYVLSRHGAIEIWQGSFSPMGKKLLLVMPGVQAPEKTKEVYRQSDVFPLIFSFYIEKADTLMDVPGSPDFVGIKKALNQALSYAITTDMRKTAIAKIDSIDRMILVYKADAAAGRGTVEGLEDARAHLKKAALLRPGEIEAKLINEKLDSVNKQLNLLQPGKSAVPKKEQPKPAVKTGSDKSDSDKEKNETPIETAPESKSSQDV